MAGESLNNAPGPPDAASGKRFMRNALCQPGGTHLTAPFNLLRFSGGKYSS
jgi:hypothetical protein